MYHIYRQVFIVNNVKKKKILLVDDELDMLNVMGAMLRDGGFDVIQTTNSKESITLAETEKPDLILLDIKMPEMDGVMTTDVLKNRPSTRDIPIAYLSNLVDEKQLVEDRTLGSKIGNLFFIPKTYPADKILEIVTRCLEHGSEKV